MTIYVLDSGASHHFIKDLFLIENMEQIDLGTVSLADGPDSSKRSYKVEFRSIGMSICACVKKKLDFSQQVGSIRLQC